MGQQFYMIQDTLTKLFSTGGMQPKWSKKGKKWNSLGALNGHFAQCPKYNALCVVVTYEMIVVREEPADNFVNDAARRKREKDRQANRDRLENLRQQLAQADQEADRKRQRLETDIMALQRKLEG